jgi:hypothetical protein
MQKKEAQMKMDQVAFYCVGENAIGELKADLQLEKAEWIADIVTAHSKVVSDLGVQSGENVAELQFCYALGIELEIIRYLSGPHWHPVMLSKKFISHVGVHLDDGEPFPLMHHSRLVQETRTLKHTSKYLTDPASPGCNRHYHYRIHEIGPQSYIKFIRRIYE